ncbi:hypothetical protein OROGR_022175 [Orobanche gracilis]
MIPRSQKIRREFSKSIDDFPQDMAPIPSTIHRFPIQVLGG